MEVDNVGVHQRHCCILHGCKYGDDDCPVESGEVVQSYTCESCDDDGIDSVSEALSVLRDNDYCVSVGTWKSELLDHLLINRIARVKPKFTNLDPDPGFEIHKIKLHEGRIFVRGEHTHWFGESQVDLLEDLW